MGRSQRPYRHLIKIRSPHGNWPRANTARTSVQVGGDICQVESGIRELSLVDTRFDSKRWSLGEMLRKVRKLGGKNVFIDDSPFGIR